MIEAASHLFHKDVKTASFGARNGSLVPFGFLLTPKSQLAMVVETPDIEKSEGRFMDVWATCFLSHATFGFHVDKIFVKIMKILHFTQN